LFPLTTWADKKISLHPKCEYILVYFMKVMACLNPLVGGVGLAVTMRMNVMERTMEIGVIRTIRSFNSSMIQSVFAEGFAIGAVVWALFFITLGLYPFYVGAVMINSLLDYTFSFGEFIIWLIDGLSKAEIAGIMPARNASRLTVHKALTLEYEFV
jgi:putative ABC transport system permease protein